jgi:hypothetical protein
VWTELDRDKALAYQREMATVCKGCGTRQAEWDEDPDAFMGDFYRCEGCARIEEERDNVDAKAKGIHYRLLPKAVAVAKMDSQAEDMRRREEAKRSDGNP